MIVDCMTCPVRGRRCDDCVVTVLRPLGSAELRPAGRQVPAGVALDAVENRVVSMFVGAGLVDAGAAAKLRARIENGHGWGRGRAVG